MPRILYMSDKAVFIVCEYVPQMKKGEREVELMQKTEATYCIPKCGLYHDASERHMQITCFNVNDSRLPEIKRQLKIT